MQRGRRVIGVAVDCGGRFADLLEFLRTEGYDFVQLPALSGLPAALDLAPDAVLVVYNPQGQDTAQRLLGALRDMQRSNPVIVLVDHSNMNEYCRFMSEGAFDYFEITGNLRWIERALRSAETQLAAA
jgi:DNA-binding NtrC family response regulator